MGFHFRAGDQSAFQAFAQGLPKMAERNSGSIQKIRYGPERPRDAISLAHFDVAIRQFTSVKNQNLRERRIPPKSRWNGHMDPARHQIGKIV